MHSLESNASQLLSLLFHELNTVIGDVLIANTSYTVAISEGLGFNKMTTAVSSKASFNLELPNYFFKACARGRSSPS